MNATVIFSIYVTGILALGIKDNRLPLADHIVDDFGKFDPAHPDPFASFREWVACGNGALFPALTVKY